MPGAILRRHWLPGKTRAEGVRLRIRELAHARPRFGYLRIWVLFRVLTVVEQWSRQRPVLEIASTMSGVTVGAALVLSTGLPAG